MSVANRNVLWASVLVEELARSGLDAVCIAPGSRSTPLTMAFMQHPSIETFIHLDERCAAFFALGRAMASQKPIAVLCTSGTATANFFPAIIEAQQSHVPLIILTTDRPPELRHSGANQTIDQIKLYGDQVLWSVDVALPEAEPSLLTIRNLQTLACRAYARSDGTVKGVVHLNFPFRKPLEPASVPTDNTTLPEMRHESAPFTSFSRGRLTPSSQQINTLASIINKYEQGIIVCGPNCPSGEFSKAVKELSKISGYPILADPLSGIRFDQNQGGIIIGAYDTFLHTAFPQPDVILRFGKVPTSTSLNTYIGASNADYFIQVADNGIWADDSHRTSHFFHVDSALLCQEVNQLLTSRESEWQSRFIENERTVWRVFENYDAFFDGRILHDTVDLLPDGANLFIGNSLPVRHLDQFAKPNEKSIHVYGNRGASGIDGIVSSALGVKSSTDQPTVLVIGDISFYHDMNGLLSAKDHPITIVLLNNNGGGIFHRLPISNFEPPFTDAFLTPHHLDFEPAAQMYGLNFVRIHGETSFKEAFTESISSSRSTIIEVRTDARNDLKHRQIFIEKIQQHMQRNS